MSVIQVLPKSERNLQEVITPGQMVKPYNRIKTDGKVDAVEMKRAVLNSCANVLSCLFSEVVLGDDAFCISSAVGQDFYQICIQKHAKVFAKMVQNELTKVYST